MWTKIYLALFITNAYNLVGTANYIYLHKQRCVYLWNLRHNVCQIDISFSYLWRSLRPVYMMPKSRNFLPFLLLEKIQKCTYLSTLGSSRTRSLAPSHTHNLQAGEAANSALACLLPEKKGERKRGELWSEHWSPDMLKWPATSKHAVCVVGF